MGPNKPAMIAAKTGTAAPATPHKPQRAKSQQPSAKKVTPCRSYNSDTGCSVGTTCEFSHAGKGGAAAKGAPAKGGGKKRSCSKSAKRGGKGAVAMVQDEGESLSGYFAFAPGSGSDPALMTVRRVSYPML